MAPGSRIWYPDEEVVVSVHAEIIHVYGGYGGLERGTKPFQNSLKNAKKQRTLYKKASVFLKELLDTRMFADGNHRTAFEVTDIFLRMNGKDTLSLIDEEEKVKFMKNIKSRGAEDVEKWLRLNDDERLKEKRCTNWHEAFRESIKSNDNALKSMNIGSKRK